MVHLVLQVVHCFLIPLACSLFGISGDVAMQVVGVGFIIGVIQDSCETGLNSSTDALFTAASEFRQWKNKENQLNGNYILILILS